MKSAIYRKIMVATDGSELVHRFQYISITKYISNTINVFIVTSLYDATFIYLK
jgi:hypothetical protein